MLAPLGVAAAPLLGDRIPVGAGFLARTPRALPDIPSACGDIPRSPAARPPAPSRRTVAAGSGAASIAARPRRDQQQREREDILDEANWLSWRIASVVARNTTATSRQTPAVPVRRRGYRARPAPRGTDRSAPPSAHGSAAVVMEADHPPRAFGNRGEIEGLGAARYVSSPIRCTEATSCGLGEIAAAVAAHTTTGVIR